MWRTKKSFFIPAVIVHRSLKVCHQTSHSDRFRLFFFSLRRDSLKVMRLDEVTRLKIMDSIKPLSLSWLLKLNQSHQLHRADMGGRMFTLCPEEETRFVVQLQDKLLSQFGPKWCTDADLSHVFFCHKIAGSFEEFMASRKLCRQTKTVIGLKKHSFPKLHYLKG